VLIITVFNQDRFSNEFRVEAGGTIQYPPLGDVEVAGKTTTQVASLLESKLKPDYLIDPHVQVKVKQYSLRTISVMGSVNKPGLVLLPEELKMDIIAAIAQAGGFHQLANENKINFTREGKSSTHRYKDLLRVRDDSKKIWLQPGDVIEVGESFF